MNIMDMTLEQIDADPALQQQAAAILAVPLIGVAYELGRLRGTLDRMTA